MGMSIDGLFATSLNKLEVYRKFSDTRCHGESLLLIIASSRQSTSVILVFEYVSNLFLWYLANLSYYYCNQY